MRTANVNGYCTITRLFLVRVRVANLHARRTMTDGLILHSRVCDGPTCIRVLLYAVCEDVRIVGPEAPV